MKTADKACLKFKEGCNCSQSVLLSFEDKLQVDERILTHISSGFGGGMASQGKTCGAVTGAYMVLGLRNGQGQTDNQTIKANTKEQIIRFNAAFEKAFGSTDCKNILGYDLSVADEAKEAGKKGLFDNRCPLFVAKAVDILEEIM